MASVPGISHKLCNHRHHVDQPSRNVSIYRPDRPHHAPAAHCIPAAHSVRALTTAVLAEYLRSTEAQSATVLYGGEFFAISIAYNLIWRHGIRDPNLRHSSLHAAGAAAISGRYTLGPFLYAVSTLLAFVSIASLTIHALLQWFSQSQIAGAGPTSVLTSSTQLLPPRTRFRNALLR